MAPNSLLTITCRYGGECGRVGYDWCANGDDHVVGSLEAGPGHTQANIEPYYGYCAIRK